MAADFWCIFCDRWTAPELNAAGEVPSCESPTCSACGEPYCCQECGFEINAAGECLRPVGPDTGYCPESVNLPTVNNPKGATP